MTFTISEDVAATFVRRVPARLRSRYVADALKQKLAGHERELLRSCEVANQDAEVKAIEQEFDTIASRIAEPWATAPRRRVVGQSRSRSRVRN